MTANAWFDGARGRTVVGCLTAGLLVVAFVGIAPSAEASVLCQFPGPTVRFCYHSFSNPVPVDVSAVEDSPDFLLVFAMVLEQRDIPNVGTVHIPCPIVFERVTTQSPWAVHDPCLAAGFTEEFLWHPEIFVRWVFEQDLSDPPLESAFLVNARLDITVDGVGVTNHETKVICLDPGCTSV